MCLEKHGIALANFRNGFVIQLTEFFNGFCFCIFETLDLSLRIFYFFSLYYTGISLKESNLSNCDSTKNTFSL